MTSRHHLSPGVIALTAAGGALIAGQSRVNGQLSTLLGNNLQAALVSFSTGFIVLCAMALLRTDLRRGLRDIRTAVGERRLPLWHLGAGMLGATFVLIQTAVVPTLGVAVFSVATLAGQSAGSLLVDRIEVRPGSRHPLSLRRLMTALITVGAVAVSVSDRLTSPGAGPLMAAVAVLAGGMIAFQRAMNAHITDHSAHGFATTWVNFATGTALLVVASVVSLLRGNAFSPLPTDAPSAYLGGVIGVVYIALAAIIVQRVDVLTFTVLSVSGQLLGSLVLDLVFPVAGLVIGWNIYAGLVLSLVGVVAGGVRPRRRSVSGTSTKEQA